VFEAFEGSLGKAPAMLRPVHEQSRVQMEMDGWDGRMKRASRVGDRDRETFCRRSGDTLQLEALEHAPGERRPTSPVALACLAWPGSAWPDLLLRLPLHTQAHRRNGVLHAPSDQ
jgi:hypothetical protein